MSLLQVLLSYFDAFKFPSSEVVQFRALVTPCMPSCEPVQCDQEDAGGELRSIQSFGRRRRRREATSREDLLLVQSIQITDKFGFNRNKTESSRRYGDDMSSMYLADDMGEGLCVSVFGVLLAGAVFLAVQLAVVGTWACVWQHRRTPYASGSYPGDGLHLSVSRTDSLCKLYDTGYARRF